MNAERELGQTGFFCSWTYVPNRYYVQPTHRTQNVTNDANEIINDIASISTYALYLVLSFFAVDGIARTINIT